MNTNYCNWFIFILLNMVFLRAYAVCETPAIFTDMPQSQIVFEDVKNRIELNARIANDPKERTAGYQKVCPVDAEGTSILFVFPYAVDVSFHMNNVFVPLDIVFFDNKGKFVSSYTMLPQLKGEEVKLYRSPSKIRYALELPKGMWREFGFSNKVKLALNIDN